MECIFLNKNTFKLLIKKIKKMETCNFDRDKDKIKIYNKDSHVVIIVTKSLNTKRFVSQISLI